MRASSRAQDRETEEREEKTKEATEKASKRAELEFLMADDDNKLGQLVYAQVPLEAHGGALQDSTQVHGARCTVHGAWVHLKMALRCTWRYTWRQHLVVNSRSSRGGSRE
jgi:hypothetical protein